MPDKERVGFVGLGIMGKAQAANLLKAGFPLTVYNRTRSKAEELGGRRSDRRRHPRRRGSEQRHHHNHGQRLAGRGAGDSGRGRRDRGCGVGLGSYRHEHDFAAGHPGYNQGAGREGREHAGRPCERGVVGCDPGHAVHHGRRGQSRTSTGVCPFSKPWARPSSTPAATAWAR